MGTWQFLKRWAIWRFFRTMVRLNHVHLPGFQGVGIYDAFKFFFEGLQDPRFSLSAMAMAYRFFFSVFPLLILVFTLLPYFPIQNLEGQVREMMAAVVPKESMGFLNKILQEFFKRPGFGLISVNLVLLLYSALGGIKVMLGAFSRKGALYRKRNFIRTNGVALFIFLTLLVLAVVTTVLVISAEYLTDYLQHKHFISSKVEAWSIVVVNWILVLTVAVISISVVYKWGPPVHERWPFFSPGSLVAGILSVAAIVFFRWFVGHFASFSKVYGSLSAVMILMVGFYWVSVVVLIGFELNAGIAKAKLHRRKGRDRLEPEFMFKKDI